MDQGRERERKKIPTQLARASHFFLQQQSFAYILDSWATDETSSWNEWMNESSLTPFLTLREIKGRSSRFLHNSLYDVSAPHVHPGFSFFWLLLLLLLPPQQIQICFYECKKRGAFHLIEKLAIFFILILYFKFLWSSFTGEKQVMKLLVLFIDLSIFFVSTIREFFSKLIHSKSRN